MHLTYTERVTTVETRQRTLEAWGHWGCYTPTSNRSLKLKAETLIKRVSEANTLAQYRSACVSFVAGWDRMTRNPNHSGAGDSAVRETVWEFMRKVCKAIGYERYADDWWEEGRERGWKQRKKN